MKRLLPFFILLITILKVNRLNAQNGSVGIGTNSPNPDASLELGDDNKGILFNRVALTSTTVWELANGAAAAGMLVYNTNPGITGNASYPASLGGVGLYYWDGSGWVSMKAVGATTYGFSAQSETLQNFDINSFGSNSGNTPSVVSFTSADVVLSEAATLNANSTITVNYSGIYDISAFTNVLAGVGYATTMAVNVAVQKSESGNWVAISGSRSLLPANSTSNGAVSMYTSALVPLNAGDVLRLVVFRGAGAVASSSDTFSTGGGGGINGVKYSKGIKLLRVKGL